MVVCELWVISVNEKGQICVLSSDKDNINIPTIDKKPYIEKAQKLFSKYTKLNIEWANPRPITYYEDHEGLVLLMGCQIPYDTELYDSYFIQASTIDPYILQMIYND
jgi:hypothetical protein